VLKGRREVFLHPQTLHLVIVKKKKRKEEKNRPLKRVKRLKEAMTKIFLNYLVLNITKIYLLWF